MARDRAGAVRRYTGSATLIVLIIAVAISLGGCGSGSLLLHRTPDRSAIKVASGVSGGQVSVITGWADALRAGHVVAAARYFRIPSVFFTGSGPPVELTSLGDVEHVNAALPCGAKLISLSRHGRYVDALFRLTNRPGPGGEGGCGSGTGQTARTFFLIGDGRILQWLRAPDQPGDNGSAPGGGATTPSAPGSTV